MSGTADIEHVIRLIPGITGTRVEVVDGVIAEVHALIGPNRHPKQVVRDIESVLAAHLGIRVDRRRISVAQVESQKSPARMYLDAIHLTLRGDVTEVQVELVWNALRLKGSASGPTSARHKLRSVASATAEAVQHVLPSSVQIVVEELSRTQVADSHAVVAVLNVLADGVEEVLVGSAFVRRDESEAAARAVLAALNNHLESWVKPVGRLRSVGA